MERTLACLADYRRELDALAIDALDAVGTSALRDARGADEFVQSASALLGVAPRVLSGSDEARLTFEGAGIGLALTGELTVFDVGGGSTEVVVGQLAHGGARIADAVSLELGSVRLYERELRADPPNRDELARLDDRLSRALASVPFVARRTLVGVAGTLTTLSAIEQRMTSYVPARVHGARLTRDRVDALARELSTMSLAERTTLAGLEPGRADVIVVGARIVRAVMAWAGARELVVSDRGVRWGLLAEMARKIVG